MTSMTLDPPLTNPLPPGSELVAGVDTHKKTHHVAILDLVGRPVADREFRADGRGRAPGGHPHRRLRADRRQHHGEGWYWAEPLTGSG